jgi:hypothetical protein
LGISNNDVLIIEGVADHHGISFLVDTPKPMRPILRVSTRQLKNIDGNLFRTELDTLLSSTIIDRLCPNTLANHYNDICTNLLDQHAPLLLKNFILHESSPWFTISLRLAKRHCRQLEGRWRETKSSVDRLAYLGARKQYFHELRVTKAKYIQSEIRKVKDTPKKLWQTLASITGDSLKLGKRSQSEHPLKQINTTAQLFSDFFCEKTDIILRNIKAGSQGCTSDHGPAILALNDKSLQELKEPCPREICNIIKSLPAKSAAHDPLPFRLVKSDIETHSFYLCELVACIIVRDRSFSRYFETSLSNTSFKKK